jgi:nitric oxide reductase NorQ protein
MAYSPSARRRDALRVALRAHQDADSVLNGRSVSNLTMAELIQVASDLGLDAQGIMDAALDASQDPQDSEDTMPDSEHDTSEDSEAAAIDAEVQRVRALIMSGGFGALDSAVRDLVIEARKPPVTVTVEIPVAGPATGAAAGNSVTVPHAHPTGQDALWSRLFGVKGTLGQRSTKLWDGAHPDTPKVQARYLFPQPQTAMVLTQIARGQNVLLYGPAGTGKTEFACQLAARTGRPFALISCDSATDGPTLVGMTVPAGQDTAWQDGQLTRAIQTPGCVICLDEPSVARPGALFVMQNVLANRVLFIGETGRRVKVAEGVIFLATDNTNGMGGGGRRGYTDTNRLNAAFLDRFGVRVRFDYLPERDECVILSARTGCTPELAKLLVTAATVTRAAADQQTVTHGIGLRRLFAWAELLMDGIDPEDAFNAAVLNCAAEQDVETLRQQCLLAYDRSQVSYALDPDNTPNPNAAAPDSNQDPDQDPALNNASLAGRAAAHAFR